MADITEYLIYTSLAHTQHFLRNVEDNNNFESDFLPDVNLSITSPHTIIYQRIMLDFILEIVNLWRKIKKQALTRQTDIVEIKTVAANINTPLQTSI